MYSSEFTTHIASIPEQPSKAKSSISFTVFGKSNLYTPDDFSKEHFANAPLPILVIFTGRLIFFCISLPVKVTISSFVQPLNR